MVHGRAPAQYPTIKDATIKTAHVASGDYSVVSIILAERSLKYLPWRPESNMGGLTRIGQTMSDIGAGEQTLKFELHEDQILSKLLTKPIG